MATYPIVDWTAVVVFFVWYVHKRTNLLELGRAVYLAV